MSVVGGFTVARGDRFDIITSNCITGQFDTYSGPSLLGDLVLNLLYQPQAIRLIAGIPADVDNDGNLDEDDVPAFIEALAALNDEAEFLTRMSGGNLGSADIDRNGLVNNLDVDGFVRIMREILVEPQPLTALNDRKNIPEPASMTILILSLGDMLKRRR